MLICPHCKNELPDDSKYCAVCGKQLSKDTKVNEMVEPLKDNDHKNAWSYLGLVSFFIGLFVFDFVLATVFNSLGLEYTFVFVISTLFYLFAFFCAIMSFVTDHRAKINGFKPSGNPTVSIAVMVINFYVCLVNFQHVLF